MKQVYALPELCLLYANIDVIRTSGPEQETLPHDNDPNKGEWDGK